MATRMLIVVSLCFVVGISVASARGQEEAVRAKVPFHFTILEKTLPPGEYTMTALPHLLKIKDEQGRVIAVALANEVSRRWSDRRPQVIFLCYGDRCFLSELWTGGPENGRRLETPRVAPELEKEQRGTYFAVLGEGPKP